MKSKKLSAIIAFAMLFSSVSPAFADDIYAPILQSDAPLAANVIIKNNFVGTPDTLTFNKLVPGDYVRVYIVKPASPTDKDTPTIAAGVVAAGKTSIDFSVNQLTQKAGSVYVTVKNVLYGVDQTTVSTLAKLDYAAEVTPSPDIKNIETLNKFF